MPRKCVSCFTKQRLKQRSAPSSSASAPAPAEDVLLNVKEEVDTDDEAVAQDPYQDVNAEAQMAELEMQYAAYLAGRKTSMPSLAAVRAVGSMKIGKFAKSKARRS